MPKRVLPESAPQHTCGKSCFRLHNGGFELPDQIKVVKGSIWNRWGPFCVAIDGEEHFAEGMRWLCGSAEVLFGGTG